MNRKLILAIIILIAIAVRLAGIDFGLPFKCHNDEPIIVNYALSYGTGDLNPHFFKVPPLLSYLLFFLYGIFFLIGKFAGYFQSVSDFGYRFLSDPTSFYLIGRVVLGLIPGSISVFLIYVLGKDIFSVRTGLFAALFLALNFLHVRDSHFIYFDIPLVFFVLIFLIILHRLFIRNSYRDWLLSGLILGVSVSVKYNAVFLALPMAIVVIRNGVHFREGWGVFLKKSILAGCMLAVGLFITNPFMFLDWKFFFSTRMPLHQLDFWYHMKVSLLGGCGILMCLAAVFGMVRTVVKRNFFPIIFMISMLSYYLLLTRSSQMAERYVFPILPLVLIFSAYAVDNCMTFIKSKGLRSVAAVCISAVLLFPSMARIYYCDRLFMAEDTRAESYYWVMENIPSDSVIVLDATGPIFPVLPRI